MTADAQTRAEAMLDAQLAKLAAPVDDITRLHTADRRAAAVSALAIALKDADSWKEVADLYHGAWLRELGGKIFPKRHRIDALVLTTRHIVQRYEDGVRRGVISPIRAGHESDRGPRVMLAGDIGMGEKDIAARAAAAAIFVDLRDRKLLSYLFAEDPENVGAYGYIDRAFEVSTQREIERLWADIIRQNLRRLPE